MRSLLVLAMSMMVVSLAAVGCAAPSVGSYDLDNRDSSHRRSHDDSDDDDDDSSDDDTGSSKNDTGSTSQSSTATMQSLTITSTGDGSGSVTSEPSGVTCTGGSCKGDFAAGTKVTLTAQAQPGSIFVGWTGSDCTGADTCTTTVASGASVTAQFITLAGTWSGTYSHSQKNGNCTFNNQGTLENTMAGTTSVTTAAAMAGLEIRNLNGCGLVDTRSGTASASAATVSGNKVTGTWNIQISGISGSLPLPFEATIIGKKMSGKWTCTGCTGSFDITRQ